ncbi:hypothetical protein PIB30_006237 [Stylosanthes scabra]|uniref:Uncharacterized protein n=1 Tax=Stylosanthes scabra TaxID=79078 RepID=A0ABU6Z3Z2_9FABA|nr:hypothetical protein [Stylosanthes scabra]
MTLIPTLQPEEKEEEPVAEDTEAEEEDGHERRERASDPFTGIHHQPRGVRVRGSSAEEELQTVQFTPKIQIFIFISFTGSKICDIKQRGARRRRRRRKRGAAAIQMIAVEVRTRC